MENGHKWCRRLAGAASLSHKCLQLLVEDRGVFSYTVLFAVASDVEDRSANLAENEMSNVNRRKVIVCAAAVCELKNLPPVNGSHRASPWGCFTASTGRKAARRMMTSKLRPL